MSIRRDVVDKMVELEKAAIESDSTWDIAYGHGFMECLRMFVEHPGVYIVERDCALAGEPGLPRLVIGAGGGDGGAGGAGGADGAGGGAGGGGGVDGVGGTDCASCHLVAS